MKHTIRIMAALMIVATMITFNACDKEDDDGGPTTFTLTSLTAGSADLNGATSATGVPVGEPITAVFNTDVDASTATESNITLTRGFDDQAVDVDIAVSGSTVTITPASDLSGGAQYILNLGGLKSAGGLDFTAIERSFETAGSFVPDDQVAYWNFDDNADDQVGAFDADAEVDVTYTDGRSEAAGKAATFNGTTSIIEVPNGEELLSDAFTLSFWIYTDTTDHYTSTGGDKGYFTMGIGGFWGYQIEIAGREQEFKVASAYTAEGPEGIVTRNFPDMVFNANGITEANNPEDDKGIDNSTTVDEDYGADGIRERLAKKWVNIIYTFDAATKVRSLYMDGELIMQQDFKLLVEDDDGVDDIGAGEEPLAGVQTMALTPSPAVGQPDYYESKWAFGFWTTRASTLGAGWGGCCHYQSTDANHFKGSLDDVRIFHRALSEEEIELMYNSEKP